jgi:hypothetical protein
MVGQGLWLAMAGALSFFPVKVLNDPAGNVWQLADQQGHWAALELESSTGQWTPKGPATTEPQGDVRGGVFTPTGDLIAITADPGEARWLAHLLDHQSGTWSVLDTYVPVAPEKYASPINVAVDSSGTIYVLGVTGRGTGTPALSWLTRKSADGGKTWTSLETSRVAGIPYSLVVSSSGAVFEAGLAGNAWQIQRSTDGGATWQSVDQITPDASAQQKDARATALAIDRAGALLALGTRTHTDATRGPVCDLILRKSADQGATWTTLSTTDVGNCGIHAFAIAPDGNLWAGGWGSTKGDNTQNFLLLKSQDGGHSFSTVDQHALQLFGPTTILPTADGGAWVGGDGQTAHYP